MEVSADALASYRRNGFMHVRGVFTQPEIAAMNDAADQFVERSRFLAKSDEIFDVGPDVRTSSVAAHPRSGAAPPRL